MPTTTPEHDARIAKMTFAAVYPHYVNKVEKKGRTKAELHEVIEWLTGFDDDRHPATHRRRGRRSRRSSDRRRSTRTLR